MSFVMYCFVMYIYIYIYIYIAVCLCVYRQEIFLVYFNQDHRKRLADFFFVLVLILAFSCLRQRYYELGWRLIIARNLWCYCRCTCIFNPCWPLSRIWVWPLYRSWEHWLEIIIWIWNMEAMNILSERMQCRFVLVWIFIIHT